MSFELLDQLTAAEPTPTPQICPHSTVKTVRFSVVCMNCGEEVNDPASFTYEKGYIKELHHGGSHCSHYRFKSTSGILNEVKDVPLSTMIKETADDFYAQTVKGVGYRGGVRRGLIYACLYYSCQYHGEPITIESLQRIYKTRKRDARKGMMKCMEILSKPITDNPSDNVVNLINEYMELLHASDEDKRATVRLFLTHATVSNLFKRSMPRSTASGFIYHYVRNKGSRLTYKDLARTFNISSQTIQRMSKEVSLAINNLNQTA